MGSGALKILPSSKVPHDQFLYFFSRGCYFMKPCVSLLLWGLSGGSCNKTLLLIANTPIVDYCITSLTWAWVLPVLPSLSGCIPGVLRAVVTQVSFLMTGVTLNFAQVSLPSASTSFLEESPSRGIYVAYHSCWVCFFTSSDASTCLSC